MAAVRFGILGGTFDPPHNAHLELARRARDQLRLDRVLWVPAGEPWRKAGQPVSPAPDRVAMVRLAIAGEPAFELSSIEVDRPGPSYTVETLEELRRREPDAELVLLLGRDALDDLPNWHEPERLVTLATLAVASRGEGDAAAAPPPGAGIVEIEMPRMDVSATELRRRAAAGERLRGLVPEAVEAYIRERQLYR